MDFPLLLCNASSPIYSFDICRDNKLPNDRSSDVGYTANDQRLAYSRSFHHSHGPRTLAIKPFLDRTVSTIDMPPEIYSVDGDDVFSGEGKAAEIGKGSALRMTGDFWGAEEWKSVDKEAVSVDFA